METKLKMANVTQFENLVRVLEENPTLAKGFTRGTVPANFKKKWEEISKQLNSLGPPYRDSDGWQKVWRDFKFKVKRKISLNKAECNATGGGRFKQLQVSPLEEAVANLMQFEKQLQPEGVVCGAQESRFVMQEREEEIRVTPNICEPDEFLLAGESQLENRNEETNNEQCLLEEINMPENIFVSSNSITGRSRASTAGRKETKRQGSTNKSSRNSLLEIHNNMQEKVFNEVSRTIGSIKNILKDTRKIEEEKLKLMKRKNEREEQLFQSEMEIKKILLEIKKRELQILNDAHKN